MLCRSVTLLTIAAMLSPGVFAGDKKKNPKDDPEAIGDRGVGKASTFIPWKKKSP